MKAVVIGAGLGGLATALRLRARGWEVTVLEAGDSFGGKMNTFQKDGFTFDTGPSLITMPHVFAGLYQAAGERMEDHISLLPVDPHAEYNFADGVRFKRPADAESWKETVRQIEPRDVQGLEKLERLSRKIYELSERTFFRRSVFSPPKVSNLSALRYIPGLQGWGNYARAVNSLFHSPYLRTIYNRYPTYVGSSPYLCPATLLVIPFIEQEFGAWYVRGGLYKIIDSLVKIADARGISLQKHSRVIVIEQDRNKVNGVRLADGSRCQADVVVMNGDVASLPDLLDGTKRSDPAARSLSGFVLLAGLKKRPASLVHHTILFSADYHREFDDLFVDRRFPTDPTIYISAPGATDPGVAPADGEALFVMANVPAIGETWTADDTKAATRAVLAKLGKLGVTIEDHELLEVWDPARFSREYLAPGGAIYGTSSHGFKGAFLRPPNRSRRFRNLYFVGGSSHPGGGTPTVLLSAKITANLIEADAVR